MYESHDSDLSSLLTSAGSDSTIPLMRTIFLADAHLVSPDDHNYQILLRFLRERETDTETLFIMGDLFDFWLGFPSNPLEQYKPVIDALERLRRTGCRLVYFEGNHDFHLGAIFRDRLGAEIHTAPAVMTIQGKRLFLCHGDQINRSDYEYRFLRLLLHNRLAAATVACFPPSLALRIRERLQKASRASYQANSNRWNYREIIRSFAVPLKDQGCDGLITGHFHLAFREQLQESPFMILSLGDWMEQFTYGELVDGEPELHTYRPSD
jgi:UDP-2,3-diacylglucosamine hydrolase